tara:strand:- start:18782 stop:18979 length:198 start_codon:yes stop_codon:yes gene_type:complete
MKKSKTVDHYESEISGSKLFELLEVPEGVERIWFWDRNVSSGMAIRKDSIQNIKVTAEVEFAHKE